jgi:hypothetical protein
MRQDISRIVHGHPDALGRVSYTEIWRDTNPTHCGKCGVVGCEHLGTPEYAMRGQVFFGVLPYERPEGLLDRFLEGEQPCGVCSHPRNNHLPDGPTRYGNGEPVPEGRPYYPAHCDRCLKADMAREDWNELPNEYRPWLHVFSATLPDAMKRRLEDAWEGSTHPHA